MSELCEHGQEWLCCTFCGERNRSEIMSELSDYRKMLSDRGFPLIRTHVDGPLTSGDRVITAELYVKWYSLYLIENGKAYQLQYGAFEEFAPEGQSYFCDHCPNPRAVEAYAEENGIYLDPCFIEICWGRWVTEGNK